MGVLAYIGIGANLGDARAQVSATLDALASLPQTRLVKRSSLYGSAPVDADGDDYVNAVALVDTGLDAAALLAALQGLEQAAGRERRYRNAPRTLDLDVLTYGEECIAQDALQVPHPRMHERAFVLLPLLEIDAAASIPGRGPAQAFVAAVAGQAIRRLED